MVSNEYGFFDMQKFEEKYAKMNRFKSDKDSKGIEWISVDHDLPEDGEKVLVVGINYEGKKDIGFSDFESSRGWSLPGNFNRIYFWSEYDVDIPEFEIKEEHNLWHECPIEKPMLKEEKLSFKERIENQREEFHREIGKELIDCLKRLTNGEV